MKNSVMKFLILFLTVFLLAAKSSTEVKSYEMLPLPSEVLNTPIHLACGATLVESNGYEDFEHVDELCSFTKEKFEEFFKLKDSRLTFGISLIPVGSKYRELNDLSFRFSSRQIKDQLIGYTSKTRHHVFSASNVGENFDVTLVHELFHALSMDNGVYDIDNEVLAEKFTYTYLKKR